MHTVLHMRVDPQQLCLPLISILGEKGAVGFAEHKMKKNRQQEVCSPLIEVPPHPDAVQCVRMSLNMSPPSSPSLLLIGSFSRLINSVNAGCAEPSWDKCSSIDQYVKQLTYPSVYMGTVCSVCMTSDAQKGKCVITASPCVHKSIITQLFFFIF